MHHQNQMIRKPGRFYRKSDTRLCVAVFFVAAACAIPLIDPFLTSGLMNHHFHHLLPVAAAVVSMILPLFMLWAISVNQRIKFNEFLKEQHRRERVKLTGKILFRAQFAPHSEGTSWELVNTNLFDWTDAHALIERVLDGKKTCEKHYLGQVDQRDKVCLESRLQDRQGCQWRILILTKEGCTTEFPDRWKKRPYEQELLHRKPRPEEGKDDRPQNEEESKKTEAMHAA